MHKRGVTILLVDDCQEDIQHVQQLVEREARIAELAVVERAWDALDHLYLSERSGGANPRRPDVILIDLGGPPLRGIEIIEDKRWDRVFEAIPVVLLCEQTDPDLRIKAAALGAHGVVRKPMTPAALSTIAKGVRSYWRGMKILGRLQEAA